MPEVSPPRTPTERRTRWTAVGAMLGCAVAYGGGLVMSKAALGAETALPPLVLLAVQLAASVVFLAALAVTRLRSVLRSISPRCTSWRP